MSTTVRAALAAASVAVIVGLAGCTAQPAPEYTAAQAEAFRSQVVAIAETSSRGEFADALAALDALQAEVERAVADGELVGERGDRIREAMALVRDDLEAAIAEAPAESESESETEPETEPEPAPAPPPAEEGGGDTDNSGPGNSDQGKSKGKGKGGG